MSDHPTVRVRLPWPDRFGYRPGLDGVRALAVLAVVLYHADVEWIPGGFLGVEVFFVLSGYLITSLMLSERSRTGTISLRDFWVRRGWRLLPAVWALLAGVFVLVLLHPDEIVRFFRELPAALAYVYNWFLVRSQQSYFESFGRPSPLQHLWSLAVEEQFYLVWPVVAFVALRTGGRRRLLGVALAGALASVIAMVVLHDAGTDPSRVYFGTDTRASGLLLGAAGAVVWHPSRHIGPTHRRGLVHLGLASLVVLALAAWRIGSDGILLYRGGMLLVSVAALLLCVAAADDGNPLAAALGIPPLRWLGTRSYAIYLWHWPVVVFTRPRIDLPADGWPVMLLRIGLTLVLAEASHRLVETRFRHGTPRAEPGRVRRPVLVAAGGVATVALGVLALVVLPTDAPMNETAIAMAAAQQVDDDPRAAVAPDSVTDDQADTPVGPTAGPPSPAAMATPAPTPATSSPTVTEDEPTEDEPTEDEPTEDEATEEPTESSDDGEDSGPLQVTAVGDSVMAGAVVELQDAIEGRELIDADVARTVEDVADIVAYHADAGSLADHVVVHTGNNGRLPAGFVDDVMDAAGPDRDVWFVTVRVPRPWEDDVNAVLHDDVPDNDNAHLLDWFALSNEQYDWFAGDGIHVVDSPGAQHYADMIADAVT